jgi:hypothetical protein
MLQKSITNDEHAFLPSGYTYLKTGQLSIMGHTPLIHIMASAPLMFLDLKIPPNMEEYYVQNNYKEYSNEFLFNYNKDKLDQIIFWGRIPMVLISMLLGFYVFRWAKEVYGVKAGLFALFLYSLSPNILAYSRLAVTDLGFGCFMFISIYYFWRFINNKKPYDLVLTGVMFGLTQVSKFSGIYLVPLFLIFISLSVFNREKKFKEIGIMLYSLFTILVIGLIVINVSYGFQGSFKSLGENLREDKSEYFDHEVFNGETIVSKIPTDNKFVRIASTFIVEEIPIIIPYPYLKSFVSIVRQTQEAKSITYYPFFIGKNTQESWYSYLVVFLIKTPIPTTILLLLSLIFFFRIKSKRGLDELFLIVPILFILVYFSFFHPINARLRYVLAIYPLLFVFISKIVNLKFLKLEWRRVFNFLIIILSVGYLLSSLMIYPHYLAYFNEFVGGPSEGYNYLVESGLDWGQDLRLLGEYIEEEGIEDINLIYFGWTNPEVYNIGYSYLKYFGDNSLDEEDCTPKNGVYAISATYLQGIYLENNQCYSWLKEYEPIDIVGYSILIYDAK